MTLRVRWIAFSLPMALALLAVRALADDWSCQDRIVTAGQSAYEVQSLCGPPDWVEHRSEVRTVRRPVTLPCRAGRGRCVAYFEDSTAVDVEEWTYDLGPRRLVRFLTFERGQLTRIRSGGYGHKLP